MIIDITKKYQTRDGRQVKFYSDDNGGNHPIHGAILDCGIWSVESWTSTGMWHVPSGTSNADLVPLPEKIRVKNTVWLNVYPDGDGHIYPTKALANAWALKTRVACVEHHLDIEVEV